MIASVNKMMRKNFINFQQCCFFHSMCRYRFLNIFKKMCTFKTCLVLFSFSCSYLLCFFLCCSPLREGDAEDQEHISKRRRRTNYFYFLLRKDEKHVAYWCNKWYIVSVSPRHCLWSVIFLISKSRANWYGPLSSKTLHQSSASIEKWTGATDQWSLNYTFRSPKFGHSFNKCQRRIIIQFVLVGCVLYKQQIVCLEIWECASLSSQWRDLIRVWFNCLN